MAVIIFDAELGEYVAQLPNGFEVFERTIDECQERYAEAMRIYLDHLRKNPHELEMPEKLEVAGS